MRICGIAVFVLVISQFTIVATPSDCSISDLREGHVADQETACRGRGSLSILPHGFIQNHGQYDKTVSYYSRTREGSVYILNTGEIVHHLLHQEAGEMTEGVVIREAIVDGLESDIRHAGKTGATVNYFKGKRESGWQKELPCYTELCFGEVYPGVRMNLSMNGGRCEKIFTVDPGADPATIRMSLPDHDEISIIEDGRLEYSSGDGTIFFSKPAAFQDIAGKRTKVSVNYSVIDQQYGFDVGEYDSKYPLTIDPLIYSTYFGGTSSEQCFQQILSTDSTIYIIGNTFSADIPMVGNSYDPTHNGGDYDIFISRLDATLTTLISSTYIGGSENDYSDMKSGLVRGNDGNIYFTASTGSTDFPVTDGAFDQVHNGGGDGVICILNSEMSELIASTYFGGSAADRCGVLAIDSQGDVYVSGSIFVGPDFPLTEGAYDTTFNGSWDIFIARFNDDLTSLEASTLIGGHSYEHPKCLLLDESGDIFMVGVTASSSYPSTPGAYDESFNSVGAFPEYDTVISRFDPGLTTLVASTFIGNNFTDEVHDAIIDGDTILYTGHSSSDKYPTTPSVIANEKQGTADIIATRINTELDTLLTSTYIGGPSTELGYALAMDDHGYIFITGYTYADRPFPTTPGAFDPNVNMDYEDGFVIRIDREFTRLTAATILGGDDVLRQFEQGNDIDVTDEGLVYVSGYTLAQDFPTTPGVIFEEPVGGYDGFISVLDQLLTLHPGKVVVAPGKGLENPPRVRVYPAAQDAVYGFEFDAYGPSRYGANVCCGNLDADEADEIITGAGPGEIYGPHVRGFEIHGTQLTGLSFLAYGTNKYGVNVAAGDIDADGFDEIITGAGPGAVFGPHVRAFNYDGGTGVTPVSGVSYFAYGTPKWGVNVTAGDIDGDGFDEIITGAGPGAVYGPHVRGWNVDGEAVSAIPNVSYFAYGTLKYGVKVSAGDVDGDGIDEIVTGAGPGQVFGAHVRGWNYDGASVAPLPGFSFFAWQPSVTRYGARVDARADLDDDGRSELIVGAGPDPEMGTRIRVYRYNNSQISEWFNLDAFPGLTHGTSVAGGRF